MIDWLEQAPDLPHLIARVSELVFRLGHAPDELVVLPRGELDRRELAAYSAGWADVVDEQLPAVRQAYEQRITAAYLQGQEDARTGRRPRRARRPGGEGERSGGEVIPLPYVQLLRPPSEVTRVEQRGERERSAADRSAVAGPVFGGTGSESAERSHGRDERQHDETVAPAEPRTARPVSGGTEEREQATAEAGAGEPAAGSDSTDDILLSAREVRQRRPATSERRPVLRRNGRPSVPPLARQDEAAGGRGKGRLAEPKEESGPPGARGEDRPRLSDRARALADELEGRAPARSHDDQPGSPGRR
ncbi:hypothetical protein VT52_019310 [Streptomyces malaysiense]|uniref:Uncharacterized protein n=1 Tax=Streptomyces malaysiense TaxID=1428626 RepID=A0A1J4PYP2_9ACTN|nr:hypothetical protein VT52_019310 [Streptomyces malaysiense]